MNKRNIGIALIAVGGVLAIVDAVAGVQAKNNTTEFSSNGYPTWYPGWLASAEDAAPLSLELMLIGTGVTLMLI